jgi:TM2 domain-containing membrane protein YozV
MAKKAVKKSRTVKPRDVVQTQPVQQPVQNSSSSEDVSETLAIVCLLLNILIIPGLGSLIGKRTKAGIWQIVLFVIGIPLCFVIIGFFVILASWIWSLITGIDIIKKAKK